LNHSPDRHHVRYWIRAWLPVLVCIALVASTSSEWFGADHTSGPFRLLFQAIFGRVGNQQWDTIHFYIRKSGHFIGYGFIGLAWLRAWWMTLPHSRFLPDAALAILGCALMASFDEWHQAYLPNRTGSPWDALLDCSGALTMQLLVYIYMRAFQPKELVHID
jgi:VanZ family protein